MPKEATGEKREENLLNESFGVPQRQEQHRELR